MSIAEKIISQFEIQYATSVEEKYQDFLHFVASYCTKKKFSPAYIGRIRTNINKALKHRGLPPLPVGWLAEAKQQSKKYEKPKKKCVPDTFLEFIINKAKHKPTQTNLAVAAMFIAGIAFGLRPVEWKNAQFQTENDKMKLIVKNAKYDKEKNKGHGEYRTIWINNPEACQKEIMAAQWLIEFARTKNWELYCYKALAVKLVRTRKKANIKQRITLHSARHQFAANAKKIFRREEVSALLGHSVVETAFEHYGKKRETNSSRPNIMQFISPDPSEVARVQQAMATPQYPWL